MFKHLQKLLLVALLCVPFVTQAQCNSGAACNITISMTDDYGDGWFDDYDDPFYINVYQNDSLLAQVTLSDGYSGTQTVSVCPNDSVRFVFIGDDYYMESSFVIYDGGGAVIISGDCSDYTTGTQIAAVANACPSCIPPSNLTVDSLTTDGIYISWTANGSETSWLVYVNGALDGTATSEEYTIYNPVEGDTYTIAVAAFCGVDDTSSFVGPLILTIPGAAITTFPYITGFEADEDTSWSFVNDGTNKWYIGSAAHSSGSKGLYISNDNGNSNNYNTSGTQFSYAYRAFSIANGGQYALSFDWKAYGESSYDYLRAWIAPATAQLTAGQTPEGGTSSYNYTTSTPTGWIDLGGKMNLQSNWQTQTATPNLAAGSYYLVFMWANDASGGTQPPVAIDNVAMNELTCPAPTALTIDSATSDAIGLHWIAGGTESEWEVTINDSSFVISTTEVEVNNLSANTLYNIGVRAICGYDDTSLVAVVSTRTACGEITSLPFAEDFNSYASSSYPSCWFRVMTDSYPYITTSYGNSIQFAGTAAVIAPLIQVLPSQMFVSFDLRKEGSSSGSMNFGFVTDPTDISSMVVLQNIDPATTATYYHYEFDLSLVDGIDTITSPVYITWRQNSTSTIWYYWLDNVLIEQVNSCTKPQNLMVNSAAADSVVVSWDEMGEASNWEVVYGPVGFQPDTVVDNFATVNADTTAVLTTLVAGQTYQVYVRSDCGDGYSNWAGPITFTPGSITMGVTGSSTMYVCGATIYDNGGVNGQYEVSSNCTLTLYPNDDTKRFKFWGSGSTESCCDYLRIYAGTSASGTMLASIQGENITIDTVFTQGGPITLYFYSDGSVNGDGFVLHVACEDLPPCRDVDNVTVVGVTTSSVYLTWEMAVGTTPLPNSFIVNVVDANSTVAATATTTDMYAMITGLDTNTSYTVTVTPSCSESDGASMAAQFTTLPLGCLYDPNSMMDTTVGNGSTTSTYIPSYSFYNYGYSQQFFKASELGGSAVINKITLTPSTINQQRTYEIYMGQSADTAASSFITPAGLTCVYNGGHIQLTAGQPVTFELTTPFPYSDTANLVVIFRDMTGSYVSGNAWLGDDAWSNASRYVYQDASAYAVPPTVTGTSQSFRNQIRFEGGVCIGDATCANPYAVVTSVDSSSVTLMWMPGAEETSWDIEYRVAGATTWTSAATGVTTTTYTITGLTPSTDYEARVVSGCTEAVYFSKVNFTTECGAAPLPLTEDFQNGTGQFARNCWLVGSTNLGTDYPYPTVVHLQGDDQNGLCLIYNGGYMVLPKVVAPLNQLQVRFNFTQGGTGVRFLMGLLPNQSEPINNIIVLDTIIRSEIDSVNAQISYTYSFAGIDPQYNGYNLAFWDAFNDNYSFIDDLVVEYIPSCSPVTALAANNVTTNSADISWSSTNATATYVIEYGPHNFTLGTGTRVTSSTTSVALTGLNHSSIYDVYVYTVCSATDTSTASALLQFNTECGAISSLPYSVDFENIMPNGSSATNILPNCWVSTAASGTQPHTVWGSSTSYYQSPTHSLYFYDNGVVALPELSIPINEVMISFFDYNTSPDSYGLVIGAVEHTNPGFDTTFVPIDTIAFTNGNASAYQVTSYLNAYNGMYTHIAIKNFSRNGNSYSTHYIDDVVIDSLPSCTPVNNLRVIGNTTSSVTLEWGDYDPNDANWVVSYSTSALSDPTQGTMIAVTAHPYTVNGLTPGTDYYFYVLNDCGGGDSSTWSAVGPVRPGTWIMRANQTDTVYMCGGTIYDDGGVNGDYSASQNSYIILRPSSPNNVVEINGIANIEGYSYDNLYIYDGEGTSGTALVSLTGSSYSSGTQVSATSTSGSLTIYFKSDGSVQYSGFELNVSCISTTCMVTNLMLDPNEAAMSNQLSLTWDANSSASSYDIEYGEAGFTLGTGNVLSSTTNSITITGLNPATSYDVYVRSICSGNDTGSWTHQTYRTALCDNASVVYSYDNTQPVESYFDIGPIGNSCYNYSYVQTLIDSARFAGLTDSITAFAFLPTNTTGHDKFNNMVMWMANVPNTSLDTLIIPDETNNVFTKVIDTTSFNYNEADWQLFAFDTPFAWDGHSNVLVVVKRDNGSYSCTAEFAAHTTSGSATTTYCVYTDGAPIDPASPYAGSNVYDDYYNAVGDMMFYACGTGCSKPNLLTPTNVDYQGATLSWTGNATEYEVAVKAATEANYPEPTTVTGNTYTASGLQAATMYLYHVRALCDTDEGLISDWREGFFTTDSLPCFAPTALHVVDSAYTTVTLGWTAGTTENLWNVHVWNTNFDTTYVVNSNPATVGGLATNMSYNAAVSALCGGGAAESEYSDTISFMTAMCAVPTGLTATNITTNSATIMWNGTASSYELQYGEHGFPEGQGTVVTVNGTSFNLTGLASETEYDVAISAVCDAGNGVQSTYTARYSFETAEEIGIADVNGLNVNIYPNPASNSTSITLSGVTGEVTIAIIDMNGRTVRSSTMSCDGDCATTIEVSDLASGAYFVRISGEEVNTVKKLVVK